MADHRPVVTPREAGSMQMKTGASTSADQLPEPLCGQLGAVTCTSLPAVRATLATTVTSSIGSTGLGTCI